MKWSFLLTADAVINFALGLPLLFVPTAAARFLGIPVPEPAFYASILGAVLTGIAIALLLEQFHERTRLTGLGLGGAITINICGSGALVAWLLFGHLELPFRGHLFLWLVAAVVLVISLVELLAHASTRRIG